MLDQVGMGRVARKVARQDPHLASILEAQGPPPLWKRPQTFATFIRIVLEQQVSLLSAKATYDRLANHVGGPVTAQSLRGVGQDELKLLGFSRQKVRYSLALADDVMEGRFRIGGLRSLSDADVEARIVARLGLGVWSARVYLMMAMLRPDVLPVGDLALVKGLTEIDDGDYRDPAALIERSDCWRPYRSVAVRMVWQSYLHRRGQVFDA